MIYMWCTHLTQCGFQQQFFTNTSFKLHVIIMSRTSFRVNLSCIVFLNFKELLARTRRHIWSLSGSNGIRIHNHLVRKRTLNHLAKLALRPKWLNVCLRTKWLWVRIPLLSQWANGQEISYKKWGFLSFLLALYVNLENEK